MASNTILHILVIGAKIRRKKSLFFYFIVLYLLKFLIFYYVPFIYYVPLWSLLFSFHLNAL
jgi:hypothetical protein